MREMSRFSCPVQILGEGTCAYLSEFSLPSCTKYPHIVGKLADSTDLIPGDVVNILTEDLALFPADMLLLSGDVIVNESMLTGESVPVSKIPIKDSDLQKWREGGPISSDLAKSLLYTGTKVIRVRGGFDHTGREQATALVVRTGMIVQPSICQLYFNPF